MNGAYTMQKKFVLLPYDWPNDTVEINNLLKSWFAKRQLAAQRIMDLLQAVLQSKLGANGSLNINKSNWAVSTGILSFRSFFHSKRGSRL